MFVPSVKGVQITIDLLNQYKHDDHINDALKPEYENITPEEFLEKYFAENDYPEELQDEVTEFFFRIFKHRKYLEKIAVSISKSSWTMKSSRELFVEIVFLYLLVIELNEVTKGDIEEILISINSHKAHEILNFFKTSDIVAKLYEWGCQIWDVEYVTDLLKNAIEYPMFEEVHRTVTNHLQKIKRRKKKELTVPLGPKCLNRTRKIAINSKEQILQSSVSRIPIYIKPTKIPFTTYAAPVEVERLKVERGKHRANAKNLFEEAQKMAFRCANLEKSEKYKALCRKIEQERLEEMNRKIKHKKIKPTAVIPAKKTATVILREGARLLKLESEEIKRYEDLANGGFNPELFAEWEEEVREEKFRKHIEDIEKKHLEGLLSYEEALLAKQKCLKRKKEQADDFKKEKESWTKELDEWKRQEQLRLQEAFDREKAVQKAAKEAMEHVKEEKHKTALEVMEESKALYALRMKEREEDLQKKVQVIKEIKALQALGALKKKQPNFSETANLGFLCEMSIAELKQRLFLLRMEVHEELQRRRAEIKARRECRKEIVDSYQDLIESHRKITNEQKKLSVREKEEIMEKRKEISRSSSCLDDLRRKLYEKRKERFEHQIL